MGPVGKRQQSDFNPRSREGSDSPYLTLIGYPLVFQSTLP